MGNPMASDTRHIEMSLSKLFLHFRRDFSVEIFIIFISNKNRDLILEAKLTCLSKISYKIVANNQDKS